MSLYRVKHMKNLHEKPDVKTSKTKYYDKVFKNNWDNDSKKGKTGIFNTMIYELNELNSDKDSDNNIDITNEHASIDSRSTNELFDSKVELLDLRSNKNTKEEEDIFLSKFETDLMGKYSDPLPETNLSPIKKEVPIVVVEKKDECKVENKLGLKIMSDFDPILEKNREGTHCIFSDRNDDHLIICNETTFPNNVYMSKDIYVKRLIAEEIVDNQETYMLQVETGKIYDFKMRRSMERVPVISILLQYNTNTYTSVSVSNLNGYLSQCTWNNGFWEMQIKTGDSSVASMFNNDGELQYFTEGNYIVIVK